MPDDLPPPEITVLPAERFGREWRFNLATSWRVDGSGGGFEGGYQEAEFRAALAEQGYDATAVSLAVVDAIKAGEAAPPGPAEGEPF